MDLLRGLRTPPWVVSLARGLVGAVLAAALLFLGDAANWINVPSEWQWAVPIILLALRQLEGALDQADSAKHSGGHATAGAPLAAPELPPADG